MKTRSNWKSEEEKRLREIESEREKSEVTSSEKNSRATGKKRKIVFERIEKSKVNFFVKESELKSAVVEGQPMILLVYKESLLNLDKSNTPLRSLVTFLLQEFEDMFSEDMPNKLPLFEVLNIKLTSYLELSFQTDWFTKVISMRLRNFKGKWRN